MPPWVLKIGWEVAKRAGSRPWPTLARKARVIATAAPCGQAPRAASLIHSRGSGPSCELDGVLTRRTSSFADSATFIFLHRIRFPSTFDAADAFSEGTRSPKKAANRSIQLLSLLFLATGSNSERITSQWDGYSAGASAVENSRLLPGTDAAIRCAILLG